MGRRLAGALGALGALVVLSAIGYAVVSPPLAAGRLVEDAVVVVVIAGAAVALYHVVSAPPAAGDVAIPPWATEGAIVPGEPERPVTEYPMSAGAFAEVVATAGSRAREAGTVEEGLAVLGPPLRAALFDALVQGGADRATVEKRLRSGEWTDNEWAAYVVEPAVGAPRWSLGQRLRAWLFPEETVRRLAREAVHGVAAAAEEAVPPVPGQGAPRTVPVATPSVADLQRGADGDLQEAIEPTAIQRGERPPAAHYALDERIATDATDGPAGDGPTQQSGPPSRMPTESPERERGSADPDRREGDGE
jgi:hypothetical protein